MRVDVFVDFVEERRDRALQHGAPMLVQTLDSCDQLVAIHVRGDGARAERRVERVARRVGAARWHLHCEAQLLFELVGVLLAEVDIVGDGDLQVLRLFARAPKRALSTIEAVKWR